MYFDNENDYYKRYEIPTRGYLTRGMKYAQLSVYFS